MSCAVCHSKSTKLLACAQCKQVTYCGAACQKKDWPTHKKSCKAPEKGTRTRKKDSILPDAAETKRENERFMNMIESMRQQLGNSEDSGPSLGDNEEGEAGSVILQPDTALEKKELAPQSSALPPPKMALHGYQAWYDKQLASLSRSPFNAQLRSLQYSPPSFLPGHCSPMTSLRSLTLQDLASSINSPVSGVLFVTTVLVNPIVVAGCSLFVQDSKNDQMPLVLYNYLTPGQDAVKSFPIGTRLALLQPFLKRADVDPTAGRLMLRCDNPEAVVIFYSDQEWNKAKKGQSADPELLNVSIVVGADDLRKKAEASRKAGSLEEACRYYTNAIHLAEADKAVDKAMLLVHRAQCHMDRRRWTAALQDAQQARLMSPESYPARVVYAQALLATQQHLEAVPVVEALLKDMQLGVFKNDIELTRLQLDMGRALRERKGQYDLAAMRRESMKGTACLSRAHANFISPDIQINPIKDGKRGGIRALKSLARNQIIMVSQAFASVDCTGVFDSLRTKADVKDSQPFDKASNNLLLTAVLQELRKNPERGPDLYALDGGKGANKGVDMARVWKLFHRNFSASNAVEFDLSAHVDIVEKLMGERPVMAGFWVTESLFNHSCVPNCTYFQIGDFRITRVNRPIAAGEELTISFINLEASFEARSTSLRKLDESFLCPCPRCGICRSRPDLAKLEAAAMIEDEQAQAEFRSLEHHEGMDVVVARCDMLDGTICHGRGDYQGALTSYQRAYKRRFACMGSGMNTLIYGLKVVGAMLAVNKEDNALAMLKELFTEHYAGQGFGESEFVSLAERHCIPVWADGPIGESTPRKEQLERLVRAAFTPSYPPPYTFRRNAENFPIFDV